MRIVFITLSSHVVLSLPLSLFFTRTLFWHTTVDRWIKHDITPCCITRSLVSRYVRRDLLYMIERHSARRACPPRSSERGRVRSHVSRSHVHSSRAPMAEWLGGIANTDTSALVAIQRTTASGHTHWYTRARARARARRRSLEPEYTYSTERTGMHALLTGAHWRATLHKRRPYTHTHTHTHKRRETAAGRIVRQLHSAESIMDIRTDGPPGPPPSTLHDLTGVHRCTQKRDRDVATYTALRFPQLRRRSRRRYNARLMR